MSLSPDIIEQIRERTTLSEIVSETVQLKRTGRNLTGLCPFHGEKTPSFSVNDEEGYFHCFGCGKSGSAFDFIMELRGYSFREAAKYLASRSGIEIPEGSAGADGKDAADRELRRALGQVLSTATDIYHRALTQNKVAEPARAYLARRQLKPELIASYRVGFAPSSWEFLFDEMKKSLFPGRVPTDDEANKLSHHLILLGLLKSREKKEQGFYDTFRGRVMFPITRSDGCAIAFGGRILQDAPDAPKYINSTEHPLYAKRRTFYGLSQALPAVRKARHVHVVEGYMDVLGLVQVGMQNALATCGTAMTEGHVQILKRFVDRVSLVFDGDAAGQKAAARCFPLFLNSGIEVAAVVLPPGEDPDSLARGRNADQVSKVFAEGTKPIADMFIDSLISEFGEVGESSAAVAGKLAQRYASTIAAVQNPVEQEFLLRHGADRFGVSFEAMKQLLGKGSGFKRPRPPVDSSATVAPSRPRLVPAATSMTREGVRVPAAAVRQNVKPVPPEHRSSYMVFLRQLVVAVVCEPMLASSLRDVSSSLAQPANDIHALGGVTTEPSRELTRTSESILSFIQEVIDSGLQAGIAEVAEDFALSHEQRWTEVLTRHGFPAPEVIAEARRQVRIGGTEPWRLVEEAAKISQKYSLVTQVRELKSAEAGPDSSKPLMEVIQEKLRARRALDELTRDKAGSS